MPDEPLRTADRTRTAPNAGPAGPVTELAAPGLSGYELQTEIGRGGMGIVYAALDRAVGRDVAIKTLIPGRPFDSDTAARFDTEAHVTARLQHPAVPPVFALGRFPDGRPYMVMKRVHGRNLAELLKQRPSPAHGITRLLGVFEDICQAVAFAHAKNIIHRDLKPSNVMIGEFGEVQVMDWGLAKQTPTVGGGWLGDEHTEHMVATPAAEMTQAGRPLGTPAYMAPEQARGEWDKVGPWSDVFALGGVLADILTGKPPFVADTAFNTLVLAGTGNVADAFARLDASGADPALLALAKRCLAPEPQHRPGGGKELADAVAAYRAGVEARLRKSEAERAAAAAREQEAQHRAEAESRAAQAADERAAEADRRAKAETANAAAQKAKRRTQLLLVAAVALLTLGAGAFAWWRDDIADERAAERRETQAKAEAERAADQLRDGEAARAALKLAVALRGQGKFREAAEAITQAEKLAVGQDDLAAEVKKVKTDTAFARDLDAVRAKKWMWTPNPNGDGGKFDAAGLPAEYAKVFRDRGFAIHAGTDAATVAARVKESAIKADVLRALDDWALLAEGKDAATATKVLEVALRASPANDLAHKLRDQKVRRDDGQLNKLLENAQEVADSVPATLFAAALMERRKGNAVVLLNVAQAKHPLDFDITFELALWHHNQMIRTPEKGEMHARAAAGHYRTARALRPDHPTALTNLGLILIDLREPAAAVAVLREAVKYHPSDHVAHFNLGGAYQAIGDLNDAETAYRRTTELSPNYAAAFNNLGLVQMQMKRGRDASQALQQAMRLAPGNPVFATNFGAFLVEARQPDAAIPILKKVLEQNPRSAPAHFAMGAALEQKKDIAGAHAAYREAIKLDPKRYAELAKKLDGADPKKDDKKEPEK